MNDWKDNWINAPMSVATVSILLTFLLNYFTKEEIKRNKKEAKDSANNQTREISKLNEKLNERLLKEVEERKNFEKSIEKEVAKGWESLFLSEQKSKNEAEKRFKEMYEKYMKLLEEKRKRENELEWEIMSLREQLRENKVLDDKQNISDDRRRKEAIQEVEAYWRYYSKNGKINRKTIAEVLWENWKNVFDNKEGEDIIVERERLIELIREAAKSSK